MYYFLMECLYIRSVTFLHPTAFPSATVIVYGVNGPAAAPTDCSLVPSQKPTYRPSKLNTEVPTPKASSGPTRKPSVEPSPSFPTATSTLSPSSKLPTVLPVSQKPTGRSYNKCYEFSKVLRISKTNILKISCKLIFNFSV